MSRHVGFVLALVAALVILAPAGSAQTWPLDAFVDDDGSVHESAIDIIANLAVTAGCNPSDNDMFCPGQSVTRGQMAAFLRRSMDLPSTSTDFFTDDNASVFEADINAIAAAGVTTGCNPPDFDEFCPGGTVTRGQMAAFLRRAVGLPPTATDFFTDDNASVFEADINAIADADITAGCNPPDLDHYCPADNVSRAQMATFLVRAFDLVAGPPEPALDFVLAFTGICDDDQLVCEEEIFFPADTPWPFEEGWFYMLPFDTGDEALFEASDTNFRVWLDGAPIPMSPQATETNGDELVRRFAGTLPPMTPGTHELVGEWWWAGERLYRTELTVYVP